MSSTPSPDSEINRESKEFEAKIDHKSGNFNSGHHVSVKRYSRTELYVLRNKSHSRKQPKCSYRSDLQTLGVWKFQASGQCSQNGSSMGSESSGMTPIVAPIPLGRPQRQLLLRNSGEHSSPSGGSGLGSVHAPSKTATLDHRSISSSHLMPAFAKRRITIIPGSSGIGLAGMRGGTGGPVIDGKISKSGNAAAEIQEVEREEKIRGGKERGFEQRLRNNEQYKTDEDRSTTSPVSQASTNSRQSHGGGGTNYDRRIGSGRLLPRELSWDYRHQENDPKNPKNVTNESDFSNSSHQSLQRNVGHFYDRSNNNNHSYDERRSFERRAGGNEEHCRDKYDMKNGSSNHQNHQNSRHLNKNDTVNASLGHRHRRNNVYNDRNEEPEWFSGGPTSQNDTIELRGFEDMEDNFHVREGDNEVQKHAVSSNIAKHGQKSGEPSGGGRGVSTKTGSLNANQKTQYKERLKNESKDSIVEDSVYKKDKTILVSKKNVCGNNESEFDHNASLSTSNRVTSTPNKVYEENQHKETTDLESKNEFHCTAQQKTAEISEHIEFNFEAFLKMDPLDPSLMRGEDDLKPDVADINSSRFSRWFGNRNGGVGSQTPTEDLSRFKDDDARQSHTLMEFLQCNRFPSSSQADIETTQLRANPIPSVEELEARMRKMGHKLDESVMDDSKKLANSTVENRTHDIKGAQSQTQDTEAFKKILEQLGAANQITPVPAIAGSQLHMQSTLGGVNPPTHSGNPMRYGLPDGMGLMLNSVSGPVPVSPSSPSKFSSNDEWKKLMQQKHMQAMVLAHSMQHQQMSPQQKKNPGNDIPTPATPAVFLAAQQHQKQLEIKHLLQAVFRGEMSVSFLKQEMNNPNTSAHGKEVIATVLQNSRSVTPSAYLTPQAPPPPLLMGPNQGLLVPTSAPRPIRLPLAIIAQPMVLPNAVMFPGQGEAHVTQQPGIPTQRELQYHTQAIMQTALFKKKLEEQQDTLRRRNVEGEAKLPQHTQMQQQTPSQQPQAQQQNVPSPTPLAFTPTSVLRKMTAEKDSTSAVVQQQHSQIQQQLSKVVCSQPQSQQSMQPRMILGGLPQQQSQYHLNNSAVIQQPHAATLSQLHQMRGNMPHSKWPSQMGNQNMSVAKAIVGRPILKAPLTSGPQQSPQQQMPQLSFETKVDVQQQMPQRRTKANQNAQHMFPHSMQPHLPQQRTQEAQQIFFQQQALNTQRPHSLDLQQHLQQKSVVDIGAQGSSGPENNTMQNSTGIINYQRDGGLSPTSNQLAQWFSPELLAQASAGKLPMLNVNQALSLEEFERSIQQHSSTTVHN